MLKPNSEAVGAWLQMVRTCHVLQRANIAHLEANGLTLPQFDMLTALALQDDIPQQELAERLLVSKGNIVGILDRLAERGFVERKPDPVDRRVNRITLTDAGQAEVRRVLPVQHELIARAMEPLTRAEQETLRGLLARLEKDVTPASPLSQCLPGRPQGDAPDAKSLPRATKDSDTTDL